MLFFKKKETKSKSQNNENSLARNKMFCYQCQEANKNEACKTIGTCGKKPETANLQDLLIYALKGVACSLTEGDMVTNPEIGRFIADSLFVTITNANFNDDAILDRITKALSIRDNLKITNAGKIKDTTSDRMVWTGTPATYHLKAQNVSIENCKNEDVRSLRELLIYGAKGIAAYAHHASVLGKEDSLIYTFLVDALVSTTKDLSQAEMVGMVLKAGEIAVTTMALLDSANTEAYGSPEITKVNLGVRNNPGILISGHDLRDLDDLLKQTDGTGVDIYTHSEMLPAHYYPEFKKYKHLVGNYGGAWYQQDEDFEKFNGPIIMTTNCITPPKDSYKNRLFTTGSAGYAGVKHIADRYEDTTKSGQKNFKEIIEMAKKCKPPVELEKGEVIGGFAHKQVLALAGKVIEAVKSGAVKRFVVMAGCDGRQKGRNYFTEVAENLPNDTIILTAGCAKYRYNKKNLGDIGGIPRILDAGQCNDCYSLAIIALKLKEAFGLKDINELPISFDIAWYEQKAVAVLLALLHLGVKGIRLGPTLPAFLSPNVAKVLVENFNIKLISDVKSDIDSMMAGK